MKKLILLLSLLLSVYAEAQTYPIYKTRKSNPRPEAIILDLKTIKPQNEKGDAPVDSNKPLNLSISGKEDILEMEYKGCALNSSFTLPAVRFNINRFNTKEAEFGSLEYFNAIGAGISFNYGRIKVKAKDDKSLDSNTTMQSDRDVSMRNIIGGSFGILFSKNDSIGGNRVIFAPTLALQLLDFQIGIGYELGSAKVSTRRKFFTVAYSIPLTKLTGTGSYLFAKPKSKKYRYNTNGLF